MKSARIFLVLITLGLASVSSQAQVKKSCWQTSAVAKELPTKFCVEALNVELVPFSLESAVRIKSDIFEGIKPLHLVKKMNGGYSVRTKVFEDVYHASDSKLETTLVLVFSIDRVGNVVSIDSVSGHQSYQQDSMHSTSRRWKKSYDYTRF